VRLFPVGVDTAKELIYVRLKIKEPGPGYCHFPAQYDDEYFRQLTAEKIVTRFSKGYRKREWKKVRARNEALDYRGYALAAYALLNANNNQIANRIAMKSESVEPKTETASPARRIRRPKQQNWVNG
jgi:phage terminase large subunit GpA-like protein